MFCKVFHLHCVERFQLDRVLNQKQRLVLIITSDLYLSCQLHTSCLCSTKLQISCINYKLLLLSSSVHNASAAVCFRHLESQLCSEHCKVSDWVDSSTTVCVLCLGSLSFWEQNCLSGVFLSVWSMVVRALWQGTVCSHSQSWITWFIECNLCPNFQLHGIIKLISKEEKGGGVE